MNVDSAARLGDCWQQFPLCSGLHETSEIKAAVINYIQITFCWNGDYREFLPGGGPARPGWVPFCCIFIRRS